MKTHQKTHGFTLIEILVYLALYAIIMTAALAAVYSLIESDAHNMTSARIEEEGDYLIAKIDWVLLNTQSINAPVNNGGTLSVTRFDNSTVSIFASGAQMRIREGSGASETLNSSDVNITNVLFMHQGDASSGLNSESISASFTLSATTTDGHHLQRDFSTLDYVRK